MTSPKNNATDYTLTTQEAAKLRRGFKFCPNCRTALIDKQVYGRLRRVCPAPDCRFIQFIDPKVAVAVLAEQNGKVVLVKRAIEPAKGAWCFPGGFMEADERPRTAAVREFGEETGLVIKITGLIDVYYYQDYRGGGVLIMYRGQVTDSQTTAGRDEDEVESVGFFGPDELPANIAFDSNVQALAAWRSRVTASPD